MKRAKGRNAGGGDGPTGGFAPPAKALIDLFDCLNQAYGDQGWWPAQSRLEVVVGAVLTQNAAWSNVERAIERLRSRGLLEERGILDAEHDVLADAIRPSGYFNVKARRLRHVIEFLHAQGGLPAFSVRPLSEQRPALLSVHGVGPETADDILLYALERPVFVIDAYTRRLLQRLGWARGDEAYETLRSGFEQGLPSNVGMLKQYHALIVVHAKGTCRKRPLCGNCVLSENCPTAPMTRIP